MISHHLLIIVDPRQCVISFSIPLITADFMLLRSGVDILHFYRILLFNIALPGNFSGLLRRNLQNQRFIGIHILIVIFTQFLIILLDVSGIVG